VPKDTIRAYYHLTKPGIIYGNTLAALAGFLLASKGHINFWLLLATLIGIALVVASACVFNNYIDRDIDSKMSRTKKRALATGEISGRSALTYATLLGITGFSVLITYTNYLTAFIGFVGFFAYIVLYGIGKRKTVHGTLIGTISGATPPVAGYCAVTNHFDAAALVLFLILVFWQMPHFYAIAIYRLKDYKAASIPVLPAVKGIHITKVSILLYIVGFIVAAVTLTLLGYTGYVYAAIIGLVGLAWIRLGLKEFKAADNTVWARKMFMFSLIVLLTFSTTVSLEAWLP